MNEIDLQLRPAPQKMVPVLIGALAMTALSTIPLLSTVNCLCCAGIMGGAVLGVWFYKKNFPSDQPFTVGNGAMIGTLSGLIAGVLTSVINALEYGMFASDFSTTFQSRIEEAFEQATVDPAAMQQLDQIRDAIAQLAAQPVALFLLLILFNEILFTAFGALGGVIGGNIFKTRIVQPLPPAQP
jgi:hypothetical protein